MISSFPFVNEVYKLYYEDYFTATDDNRRYDHERCLLGYIAAGSDRLGEVCGRMASGLSRL